MFKPLHIPVKRPGTYFRSVLYFCRAVLSFGGKQHGQAKGALYFGLVVHGFLGVWFSLVQWCSVWISHCWWFLFFMVGKEVTFMIFSGKVGET
jgi:hypothetical protein